MKKTLLYTFSILILISSLSSCRKDEDGLINYDESKLNQTIYANDIKTDEPFSFTATSDWHLEVGKSCTWLRATPSSGESGDVELAIITCMNYTGKDRKAEIKINSNSSTIIITINQKGTTSSGEVPDAPTVIKSIIVNWEGSPTTQTTSYIYNENYQLIELEEDYGNTIDLSYENNVIVETFVTPEGLVPSSKTYHLLNAEGYVISSDATDINEGIYSTTYNDEYIDKVDDKYTFTWSDNNLSKIKHSDLDFTTFSYNSKLFNLTNFDINVILYQTATAKSSYTNRFSPALIKKAGKISQHLIEKEVNSYTSGNYSRLENFRFVYEFNTLGHPKKVYIYTSYGVTYDYPNTPIGDLKPEVLEAVISFNYY